MAVDKRRDEKLREVAKSQSQMRDAIEQNGRLIEENERLIDEHRRYWRRERLRQF
jgi:hypothetical protein